MSIDEPTVFAQEDDDVRQGTIERVLTLRNDAGEPYEVAFARLERPIAYGVHSSSVISMMTRYAKDRLSDLLSNPMLIVNIGLEEERTLHSEPADPSMRDKSRSFYLGFGTVSLDRTAE